MECYHPEIALFAIIDFPHTLFHNSHHHAYSNFIPPLGFCCFLGLSLLPVILVLRILHLFRCFCFFSLVPFSSFTSNFNFSLPFLTIVPCTKQLQSIPTKKLNYCGDQVFCAADHSTYLKRSSQCACGARFICMQQFNIFKALTIIMEQLYTQNHEICSNWLLKCSY